LTANKTFSCPKCKRVYFLPANGTYLCNEERNFGLPAHEPWAVPEFVDYDSYARSLTCLFGACAGPACHHRSWRHDYVLMTREEVVEKYKQVVLAQIEE
jgi:hypothetical protein